jgi:hypothetical protein
LAIRQAERKAIHMTRLFKRDSAPVLVPEDIGGDVLALPHDAFVTLLERMSAGGNTPAECAIFSRIRQFRLARALSLKQ